MRLALRERARGKREPLSVDGRLPEVGATLLEPIHDPAVADALRALPERRRLIAFLHYFADLSYDEIAEICEVTPGTVAATLAQARDSVRASLEASNEVTT